MFKNLNKTHFSNLVSRCYYIKQYLVFFGIQTFHNFQFVMTIDKWNNGDWDLNFYDARGPVCQVINQYVSRAWAKVRQEIEPQISEPCHALAVSESFHELRIKKIILVFFFSGSLQTYRL